MAYENSQAQAPEVVFPFETPRVTKELILCASTLLRQKVDTVWNEALIIQAETGDSTAILEARDPISMDCEACKGTATFNRHEGAKAPAECFASGSCEESWVELHADHYVDGSRNEMYGRLPCGGLDCQAIVQRVETVWGVGIGIEGKCQLDLAADRFREGGQEEYSKMDGPNNVWPTGCDTHRSGPRPPASE